MSSAASKRIIAEVKRIIPPLSEKLHKGQAGRVGVIGGSQDYSGAPFFASISALRLGCDLSHVICEPEAGHVIKTYSPDLIVHPILKAFPKNESSKEHYNETVNKLTGILSRLHVIVVGPGLGRDDHMQDFARAAISIARSQDKYIVIDADGLWLVQNEPGCIKGYAKAVLTPNVVEFDRLLQALKIDKDEGPREELASKLSAALGNVVILQKGAKDLISNGKDTETVDEPGGLKRVGGQGDILSGTVATFLAWGKSYVEGGLDGGDAQDRIDTNRIPLLAAYGGSTITRKTSRLANAKHGRGVLTSDMLMEIGSAYQELFGERGEKGFKGNL